MHQYYVKVVPTVYSYLDGSTREVWQYSVRRAASLFCRRGDGVAERFPCALDAAPACREVPDPPPVRPRRRPPQVTEHVRHVTPGSGRGLPGVFFFYEVSPLVAEFEERRQGWRALLTGLAAIVGGVHATAALVDRTLAALLAKHSSRGLTH
jgi:hypothetical protein